MLRYKTETRPGLVALYDIRPGNGAGLFLQPGAHTWQHHTHKKSTIKRQREPALVDRLVQHPARKRSGSVLTTRSPHMATSYTQKIYAKTTERACFSRSPCTTSSQETERVYSYNPGARTGQYTHTKSMLKGQREPGLVAFYDIRPGNEAGLFLQPRSPHRRAVF